MRWEKKARSADLEDRRRGGGVQKAAIGGGGIIGIVLVLLFGMSPEQAGLMAPAGASRQQPDEPFETTAEEEELVDFVSWVLDDIQSTFNGLFQEAGLPYQRAKLVLFRDQVSSACGVQGAQVGPFYCPADQKAYIDLSFYKVLRERLGAPGDFAQAYVLGHELGHHLQTLLGTSAKVHQMKQRNPKEANALSVRQELQADCYAGVWAHHTAKRGTLGYGDLEDGLRAAGAIGDDALQRGAGQAVRPETFTHGTSKQRQEWLERGYREGRLEACDTFQ